jgi:hypothetical protein
MLTERLAMRHVMRLRAAGMPGLRDRPAGGDGRLDGAVDDPRVRGGGAELAVAR